jgi:Arc/MetJ-type ribon-helix-helix transcriptional regulator
MTTSATSSQSVILELDEGLAETIRASMALGGFSSAADFLRSAAEEWHSSHMPSDVDAEALRALLEDGLESGDAVAFQPFVAGLKDRLDAKRASQA